MKLAYKAIELAVLTDPTTDEGNPFHEIAAAHLLVEMAKSGEAVDAVGRPLLTQDEVARLEHYYGTVDPVTKQVDIRRLNVPITCSVPSGRWKSAGRSESGSGSGTGAAPSPRPNRKSATSSARPAATTTTTCARR